MATVVVAAVAAVVVVVAVILILIIIITCVTFPHSSPSPSTIMLDSDTLNFFVLNRLILKMELNTE